MKFLSGKITKLHKDIWPVVLTAIYSALIWNFFFIPPLFNFTIIDSASVRLNRQVENLPNMSRLESGLIKPQLDWCDMSELIHKVIQNIQLENSSHRIKFAPEEEIPLFKLDRGLIEQVIYNIIHNSIQYTPSQSIISIDVAHQDESCIITISDNGPGFPEKELIAVFKKFYRLPNTAAGGTGLSLINRQRICRCSSRRSFFGKPKGRWGKVHYRYLRRNLLFKGHTIGKLVVKKKTGF